MTSCVKYRLLFCVICIYGSVPAWAQPLAIATGPNYGTWSIGEVNGVELIATGGSGTGYTWR